LRCYGCARIRSIRGAILFGRSIIFSTGAAGCALASCTDSKAEITAPLVMLQPPNLREACYRPVALGDKLTGLSKCQDFCYVSRNR